MKKYKIFVSANQKELFKERKAVKELVQDNILLNEHFNVFLFEDHPAQGKSANKVYIEEVLKSDIYIGILGTRYGEKRTDGVSATEKEFHIARNRRKEILIYIKGKDDSQKEESVKKIINEIKKSEGGYKYKRFTDISSLKTNIFESLVMFLRAKNIITKAVFDMSICEKAEYKNIDKEKMRWFLQIAREHRNYAKYDPGSFKDAFTHLNLLNNGKLTNAAILLFGKDPQKFHMQAEVKCLRFHGTEIEKPFKSYHIYKSNIFEQIDKALDFVLDALSLPVIRQPGTAAVKRPYEIPEFVIQEAIVNAVAHRDYFSSSGVQVMVFIDRIEIWNPGQLPPQLTVESLKRPHASYPHNPLLSEVLYLANYIQKAGSGTLEMIKQCKSYSLPEPEFLQQSGQFIIKIWRDIFTESYIAKLGLSERHLKAIRYVKEKKRITNEEYQRLNNVKRRLASYDLTILVKKGIVERIGKVGKGTHYRLKQ